MQVIESLKKYKFLFEELTKRDFKKKYKRTVFGMLWSVLSPLLTLFIMRLVFTKFFGSSIAHFTIYLFAGQLVFSYFQESTNTAMMALVNNKDIYAKVKMPKYMFVLSSNASSFFNFMLTLAVFFIFVAVDGIAFSWNFLMLLYPILCLLGFNMGVGLILSAVNLFFRDTQYLYGIFSLLLMYMSAIFYDVSIFSANMQRLFLANPVYVYIKYFRIVVIDGNIPSLAFSLLALLYPALAIGIGAWLYKKYDQRFMYYV